MAFWICKRCRCAEASNSELVELGDGSAVHRRIDIFKLCQSVPRSAAGVAKRLKVPEPEEAARSWGVLPLRGMSAEGAAMGAVS